MVDADELDLAVVISMPGNQDGTLLRQTQFVWVAAETFEMSEDSLLPLAFAPMPCVNRQIGIAALGGTSLEWQIVFTSPSQQGIRAAVLAGLAVTVLTREELEPGMKIVSGQYGLPSLPNAKFMLAWSARGKTPAAIEFGQLILNMAGSLPRESKLAKARRKQSGLKSAGRC